MQMGAAAKDQSTYPGQYCVHGTIACRTSLLRFFHACGRRRLNMFRTKTARPSLHSEIDTRAGDDAAVAHLGLEIEMITLRVVDPSHVVERQVVAIARGQAL